MRPLKPGWPPETETTPTTDAWQSVWERKLDIAQRQQDADTLKLLYRELTERVTPQEASTLWMQKMSAWDSSAITG